MAEAGSSLQSQAQELVQVVAVFKLSDGDGAAAQRPGLRAPMASAAKSFVPPPRRAAIASVKRPALAGQAKALSAPAISR